MSLAAAIDAGTSSVRVMLFDRFGNSVASASRPMTLITPEPGIVEQKPFEIIENVYACMADVLNNSGHKISDIKCCGITNQRSTFIFWNKHTGKPYYNALVWQDSRTADECQNGYTNAQKEMVRKSTGLPVDPIWSATKVKWVLENVEQVREDIQAVKFGTVDAWIIWNLFFQNSDSPQTEEHFTDVSNACITMLMNLETLAWDPQLLKLFGDIPIAILPTIVSTNHYFGPISDRKCPFFGIPVSGSIGDQQSAALGQLCFQRSDVKNTYGTGAFLLCNTGQKIVRSVNGNCTVALWKFDRNKKQKQKQKQNQKQTESKEEIEEERNINTESELSLLDPDSGQCFYGLEGYIAVAGQGVQFLRDNLGIIAESAEINKYAAEVDDCGGVYFVTSFCGLLSPYWRSDVKGMIYGLTMNTNRAMICRSVLESVCYRTSELYAAMKEDCCDSRINALRVDGGMCRSDVMLQIQSDMLQTRVIRPQMTETTALGAVIAAGICPQILFWKDLEDVKTCIESAAKPDIFEPQMTGKQASILKSNWKQAIDRCLYQPSVVNASTNAQLE